MKNVTNIDQFLYLVRAQTKNKDDDNLYQLEMVDYEEIRIKDKEANFDYYTISKKGFCHYYNGKPIQFIELDEWLK